MIVSRYFSTIPDGNPVPSGVEVELRLHVDNSLVATAEIDNGWVTFVVDGNPGPHYLRCLYNGEAQVVSSRATGVSVATDVGNLPLFIRTFRDGYVAGALGELVVTGPGSAVAVSVAPGAAYVRGVLYDQRASRTLSLAAPDVQPRIDSIVVEVVPPGGPFATEGRSRLMVKTGVPAASPVAPSLTQTDALWEHELARVRIDPGIAAVAQNAITDTRVRMSPLLAPGSVTNEHLAGGVVAEKLTSGTNRSTVAGSILLKASLDSPTPNWGGLLMSQLLDFGEEAPNEGEVVTWYQGGYRPRPASGGGVGGSLTEFKDANFDGKGIAAYGAGTVLQTATVTVPAGTWLIDGEVDVSLRGSSGGWSTSVLSLAGSGAPSGDDASSRIFDTVQGVPRQAVLSGRKVVTGPGDFAVTARVTGRTGSVEVLSGVVRVKAHRKG